MMKTCKFSFSGHENILATHKNTFEFTKEAELSKEGDCILGVKADYDLEQLRDFIKDRIEVKIKISVAETYDEVKAALNNEFSDDHELVIRLGDYASARTLGVRADKAAKHIKRELVEKLKNPDAVGTVELS